ncbi:MAG TPA: hypothetical protein VJN66_06120 [Rhodanobacteraceae bacterium]|nr:hypothetical protein [Rhodanobacteraceae bacterium]
MSKRWFCLYPMAACMAMLPLAAVQAQDTGFSNLTLPAQTSNAGHGSVSIGYSRPFYHGDYGGPAGINSGQVQFQVITLSASYFISDHWEVRANIPFVRGKSDGLQQHMQLPCPPPGGTLAQCVPVRVDDGHYHGTWADWDFGLGYYTVIGDNYYVTPTLDVYIPSHNYAYYGAAIVGERVTRYGIGVQLQHQFDFSNFYYTVVYQYVIKPTFLGINSNYSELAIDLGYFINPKLGVRLITDTKIGSGLDDAELNASIATPEGPPDFNQGVLWPIHDKMRKQNHLNVGFALDYAISQRNALTFAALRSVWGQSNARLQNGIALTLTHGF